MGALAVPAFQTPEPISVTISLVMGDVRIVASDRSDTVVVVSASDPSRPSAVKAAEQVHVDYSLGRLLIKEPRTWKHYTPFGGGESIDVAIELPVGSRVEADLAMGDFLSEGRLGDSRFTTGAGNIRLDETGPLYLSTGAGRVIVDRIVGRSEITGSGQLRIREVDGPAVVKNLNGANWLGEATGDLRCNSANGDITIDRALADVAAKTANGAVRIGEVVHGSVELGTAMGELEVGIREGTAALLDVRSQYGNVRNFLTASDGPKPSDQTVEVRARTSYGDIVIRRSESKTYGEKGR